MSLNASPLKLLNQTDWLFTPKCLPYCQGKCSLLFDFFKTSWQCQWLGGKEEASQGLQRDLFPNPHTSTSRRYTLCHKPRNWSMTDWYKATLLQGKQAQDASLGFPYQPRPGRTAGNSHGHSLIQVPECGNMFNQTWESCTTTRQSGDQITQEKWYDFQGN